MIVVFPFLRVTGLRTKQGEFEQKEAKVTKGEFGGLALRRIFA